MNNLLINILEWFRAVKPEPKATDVQVQLGCHLEEVLEMVQELGTRDVNSLSKLNGLKLALKQVSDALKQGKMHVEIKSDEDLLDALGDQIITTLGVGAFLRYDMIGALQEINRSNYSKFENYKPKFNEYGKVIKGANYFKPSLGKFIHGRSYAVAQERVVGHSPETSNR